MAEVRAKNFKATEFYLINDYKIFPSGTLGPEVAAAVENGLITYTTVQIAEPENPATEMDTFIVAPTTKLLNLLDDLKTIHQEKPGPKTHSRQLSAGGKKFDVRSGRVHMLVDAKIQDLENVTYSLLHQLRTSNVKVVQRRMKGELHDIMLLRGSDLPRSLYDTVNLRLRGLFDDLPDSALDAIPADGVIKGTAWTPRLSHEKWA
jgi:hypothetical protein